MMSHDRILESCADDRKVSTEVMTGGFEGGADGIPLKAGPFGR